MVTRRFYTGTIKKSSKTVAYTSNNVKRVSLRYAIYLKWWGFINFTLKYRQIDRKKWVNSDKSEK